MSRIQPISTKNAQSKGERTPGWRPRKTRDDSQYDAHHGPFTGGVGNLS